MRQRDVMSLIKQSAPLLSMEAYEEDDRPLGAAIEAAGREEACVWHRVRCCPSPTHHCQYQASLRQIAIRPRAMPFNPLHPRLVYHCTLMASGQVSPVDQSHSNYLDKMFRPVLRDFCDVVAVMGAGVRAG